MSIYLADNLTEKGAKSLAAKVQSYWRDNGAAHVRIRVEQDEKVPSAFVLRSNLVGGLPPEVRST